MRGWMTALVLSVGLMGCGDNNSDSSDSGSDASDSGSVTDGDDEPSTSGACELADEAQVCLECYDGEVTCTYGEEIVTEGSCGDCQARVALYAQLCDAGIDDSRTDIEAGLECTDPV